MASEKRLTHARRPSNPSTPGWRFFMTGRRLILVIILALVLFVLAWRKPVLSRSPPPVVEHIPLRTDEPPTWEWLKKWERDLPQHDLSLRPPDAQQLGWNNVQTELLMNAHLAYESRRGYRRGEEHRQWPPHTPLNALLSGPVAGGSWDWDDDTPRSITPAWFDIVCPPSQRRYLNSSDVKHGIEWSEGDVIFDNWATTLRDIPDRCLEILPSDDDRFPQVFDIWLWGNTRLLSIWDSFSKSPVARLLHPSPVVKAAVERNEYLFLPRGPRPSTKAGHSTYDRVLAMHIRRGDYEGACKHFATWSSTFYGWNQLELLPDRFVPPPGSSWGENTPENVEIYMKRCLPSIEDVVSKVQAAKLEYDGVLDVMYLLTNEKGEWLDRLLYALRRDGWKTIKTSRELLLENVEQKEVAMAIDMDIARRSAVFVGNGVS
ncbi:hypothetical protein CPB85DRAFT_1282024 [Mucidula mucida]|nr:hypothetical protein CPB85DRAFT_1282024 [Mucidula mucida]